MGKRYKRVMKVSGAGLLMCLLLAVCIRLMGLEPLPILTALGLLCGMVFVAAPIVWANRKPQGNQ